MKREKDGAYWFFVGFETGMGVIALAVIVDFLIDCF